MIARLKACIDRSRQLILEELQADDGQHNRAAELHRRAIVCDTYGNASTSHWCGTPYSAAMEDYARRRLAEMDFDAAESPAKLINALRDEIISLRTTEFAHDPDLKETIRDIWETADVNVGTESFAYGWVGGQDRTGTIADFVPVMARASYVYDHVDFLQKIVRVDQIEPLKAQGKRAVLWHCGEPDSWFAGAELRSYRGVWPVPKIADPLRNLDIMFALGFRMTQLTNSTKNQVGCSHAQNDDTGLTDLGRDLIARMNELGMIIDLAHSGPNTMLDVIEASNDPVVTSHGACRAVAVGGKSRNRNMTDQAIKAMADKGGMISITLPPNLLGGFGIDQFFKHLEHAIELVGVDHVGIGTDETGLNQRHEPDEFRKYLKPAGFAQPTPTEEGGLKLKGTKEYWTYDYEPQPMIWTNWPCWATLAMVCRGYPDADIEKIIGGNFIRTIGPILDKRPRGPLV